MQLQDSGCQKKNNNMAVSFAQANKNGWGNNNNNSNKAQEKGNNHNQVKCYVCDQIGHIAKDWPNKGNNNSLQGAVVQANVGGTNNGNNNNASSLQSAVNFFNMSLFQERSKLAAMHDWILLGNQSTTDIFCNKNLLSNVHETNKIMTIYTNAGSFSTRIKGTLNNYGLVWYSEKAITNILALCNMIRK